MKNNTPLDHIRCRQLLTNIYIPVAVQLDAKYIVSNLMNNIAQCVKYSV